ncbi:hypothetical protein BDN72DRAFT_959423 [Pluteus cervinus]|uniref:Uncharacterized protein n=1 Tax=Pluteus cervinus TaxID=181527 RepID=A0ACD3AV74_9AGAR|nr:hypothetical protein BDN72DRAFT_959423 [Pluteus cervinus]
MVLAPVQQSIQGYQPSQLKYLQPFVSRQFARPSARPLHPSLTTNPTTLKPNPTTFIMSTMTLASQRCTLRRSADSTRLIRPDIPSIPIPTDDDTQQVETSGLLALPDELLLQICEMVNKELPNLAYLSRRLHYLIFPMYLARRGIPQQALAPNGELILSGDKLDVIPLLQASLFVTSLKHLSYTFRSLELSFDTWILRDLRFLDNFLARLQSLDELTLDFTNINWNLWPSDQSHRGWSSHLGFLLNTIITIPCRVLTLLRGTPADKTASQKARPTKRPSSSGGDGPDGQRSLHAPRRPLAALKKVVLGGKPERSPSPNHTAHAIISDSRSIRLSQSARAKVALTKFKVHSPLFLIYPCRNWTIEVINISPITSLSFGPMGISSEQWTDTLQSLTVPALTDLAFNSCPIATTDLVDFLIRHPKISHLHLDRILQPSPVPIYLPDDCLSELTSFAADLEGLITFLIMARGLTKLRSIWFLWRIASGHRFDLHPLIQKYDALAPLITTGSTIGVKIALESGSKDWLFANLPRHLENRETESTFLQSVTHLSFVSEFVYATHPPTWLYLFPQLRWVSFKRCTEPTMDMSDFVSAVRASCPTLTNLEINGLDHIAVTLDRHPDTHGVE